MGTNIGDVSQRETFEKGKAKSRFQKETTKTYRGLYTELLCTYNNLSVKTDEDISRTVSLTGDLGALGVLTIHETEATGLLDEWFEIDMAQLDQSIYLNPVLFPPDDYDEDDIAEIANHVSLWENSDNALKSEWKYSTGTDVQTLTAKEKQCAKFVAAGQTTFVSFFPVVRKTSIYDKKPSSYGINIGKKNSPSQMASLANEWLKTADRLVQGRDNNWTRTEEWTGADKWSSNLYQTSN